MLVHKFKSQLHKFFQFWSKIGAKKFEYAANPSQRAKDSYESWKMVVHVAWINTNNAGSHSPEQELQKLVKNE